MSNGTLLEWVMLFLEVIEHQLNRVPAVEYLCVLLVRKFAKAPQAVLNTATALVYSKIDGKMLFLKALHTLVAESGEINL